MTALLVGAFKKYINAKQKFSDYHFHYILRHFGVSANFPFTASEAMRNYYL